MLGVSGVAVLASRGGPESGIAGDEPTTTWSMTGAGPICVYDPVAALPTTTTEYFGEGSTTLVGSTFPSEETSTTVSDSSGCTPSGQFRCIGNTGMDDQGYTYFEWCEPTDFTTTTYPYPQTTIAYPGGTTMPDYTTYEVFETTTTSLPPPTTTESQLMPTTSNLATTTT